MIFRTRKLYSHFCSSKSMEGVQDIIRNFKHIEGNTARIAKIFISAFNAYRYPTESTHLNHLGDLSGYICLQDIQKKMMADEVGRQILEEKPRVNSKTMNLNELKQLEPNTFGFRYAKFMLDNGFVSDERPLVEHVPDLELAYIYQRYKEIHDFIHALLVQDPDVHGEIVVKWFEMAQLGLPSTSLGALVGALKLTCEEKRKLFLVQLPQVLQSAQNGKFVMNVYFEKEINTDIDVLRKRLRINRIR